MSDMVKATIFPYILEFQEKFSGIEKNQMNAFTKSRYASLDDVMNAIQPILSEVGLVIMQPLDVIDGAQTLRTYIVHSETGASMHSDLKLDGIMEKLTPQGLGSAITYARRYAICSLLNIVEMSDDDGNSCEKTVMAQEKPATDEQLAQVRELINKTGSELDKVRAHCQNNFGSDINNMTAPQAEVLMTMLRRKLNYAKK